MGLEQDKPGYSNCPTSKNNGAKNMHDKEYCMQSKLRMFSLLLVCGFAVPLVPAFAANYCSSLLSTERRECSQQQNACDANVASGCADPNVPCDNCYGRLQACMDDAENDYYDCNGSSVPPPCSGPLCGVAYRTKATGKFDPNHLVLNLVFPATPATTNKLAVQIRRSCNGS